MEPRHDGRDIDTTIASLSGEASGQRVEKEDEHHWQLVPKVWAEVPGVRPEDPTYYDRPMLQAPAWLPAIPVYFFFGGAAGAALALGAAAQLTGDRKLDPFVQHCHWIGIIGSTLGAGLLVYDLGRPSRFLNMMRVFRPTSPMNIGSWILGGAAPLAITAGLFARKGPLSWLGEAAGYASGLFGTALAGYTAVLLTNSAIPVWQEARRLMPVLFFASSMTSAASLLDLYYDEARARRITFSFGTAGRLAELAAAYGVERDVSRVPQVGLPLREGRSGKLWKTAAALTAASLVVSLIPGQSKTRRRIAGILGALGSLCLRFAVYESGKASARDPRASFRLQRADREVSDLPSTR